MYRAYHAIRGLTGPDGRSTNAVYGFITMLRKLLADHHPAYIAASFDLPSATFRDGISADYKANRAPMPGDLKEQIPWVHEACEAMGVPILTCEGYEADDVIGTLARQAAAAGFEVAIVTGDKDFFQLVDGPIRVYNPKDDGAWFDAAGVKEKFGVSPEQVVDVLALMGDAIDNVKALIAADVPMFGICLGHQLLALGLGATTYKLKFGHRGANHPVKFLETGAIEITSQNHGFAVDPDSLPTGTEMTHKNLYDGTCEGVRHTSKPVFSVQYHPEASPGPHDADYLFRQFVDLMESH